MSRKKVSTRKFYIKDLVRDKSGLKYITIPPHRVDVEMEVTTKGLISASDVPSSVFDRLEKVAREELDRYEDIITSEAKKLDKKVEVLLKSGPSGQEQAKKLIQGTDASIKNALKSAEGAAQQAIEKRLKVEAQGDKNLKEAQVRTAIKWTAGAISIATNIGSLVGSSGADVTAYLSIAKTVHSLAMDVVQHAKNEAKLRSDLDKAVQSMIAQRATAIQQAATRNQLSLSGIEPSQPLNAIKAMAAKVAAAGQAATQGKSPKDVMLDVTKFIYATIKSEVNNVETCRKHYREHTTKTRQRADDLSLNADKLMKAMKSASSLSEGVKIGQSCMALKRQVTALNAKLADREKYLLEIQDLMEMNGLKIDDRTTLQKIKQLDSTTIVSELKDIASHASAIAELVQEFA